LKKQDIGLDWQVNEVPRLACMTPREVLHILRILQEAVTNILKHAHAGLISVETGTGTLTDGTPYPRTRQRQWVRWRPQRARCCRYEVARSDHRRGTARSTVPTGTTLNLLLPLV
jgi:two-component sensor histidine kinase